MPKKRINIRNYLVFILIAGAAAYSYFHSQEVYSWYMRTYYEKIRGISPDMQIREARKMLSAGEYEKLAVYLKPLIMAYPENRELKTLEGLTLIRQGNPGEGADIILTATEDGRLTEPLLAETTTALFEKKMFRDITNLFRKNTPGNNPGLLYMLGVSLFETGSHAKAVTHLKRSYDRGRNGSEASHYLGRAYVLTGDTRAALPYLERAHRLDRVDPDIGTSLADAYRKLGRIDDAAKIMRSIHR
ncbi:MAG: tetratricopeptide repeat protein [Spirochaetes bacterium]|nr:tetratricopeptide repeat protein [Spirochaetota bacterium]